jgi:hypothetical protein
MKDNVLNAQKIEETIGNLHLRINDRFPDSGLEGVCRQLHDISKETSRTCEWIERPNYALRWATYAIIAVLGAALVFSVALIPIESHRLDIAGFVTMTEAAISEVILIGAGIFFLVTLETRRKRKRVVSSVNKLRSLAHITDAHQLTKDPDGTAKISAPTAHSPQRDMNEYELGRYLDYCSEILSLTGKLGFLYVQHFDDPVATNAVNELETMTTGLSRKIWQKIMILRTRNG